MENLAAQLAEIFDVKSNEISLQRLTKGLSFPCYRCEIGSENYFVKNYPTGKAAAESVLHINELTSYMRQRGIPAPEVALFSPAFPNIVVHKFIQGEHYIGQDGQLQSVAQLFSQLCIIGLESAQELSKDTYVSMFSETCDELDLLPDRLSNLDYSVHSKILVVVGQVLSALQKEFSDEPMMQIPVHDDFTERNILMSGSRVALLCDWDSFHLNSLQEYIARVAARFCTEGPLQGELQFDKLELFFANLDSNVIAQIQDKERFAQLFPILATIKHIKAYAFRSTLIYLGREDLKASLLDWPAEHCGWLIENRQLLSDWLKKILERSSRGIENKIH